MAEGGLLLAGGRLSIYAEKLSRFSSKSEPPVVQQASPDLD